MKRLLSVVLLMLCLSFSVLGGHNLPGNWCECGAPGCICDPGEVPVGQSSHAVPKPDKTTHNTPTDVGSGTLLVLAVLLLMLRYKA